MISENYIYSLPLASDGYREDVFAVICVLWKKKKGISVELSKLSGVTQNFTFWFPRTIFTH